MMFVAFLILIKTFFYMRVFREMSQMVAMIRQVITDLRVFMIFYFILIWMCSLIFNIIDLGNNENTTRLRRDMTKAKKVYPGMEYAKLPLFLG